MNKRELGQSGIMVSEIGLGCMSLPTNQREAQLIVDAAIEHGITYFDTADLYDKGKNEDVIGHALKGKRQDIILASKVGNKWNEDASGWTWDSSKSYITSQIKESLQRLQTDYLDLYQLHGGTMEDDLEEAVDAFESLKKEGLIRAYGISSIRPNVIHRFLRNGKASSVMMQYSMLDRRSEEWFDMIASLGSSVVTRGSLAKGLLTPDALKRAEKSDGYGEYKKEALIETLSQLTQTTQNLHSAALAFVLQYNQVSAILAGASSANQLEETMQAYHQPMTPEQLAHLKEYLRADIYKDHRL